MTKLDLTDPELAPVHLIGRVQSHGALIALGRSWTVTHASENADRFLGTPAQMLIGQPVSDVFSQDLVHDIRTKMQMVAGSDVTLPMRAVDLPGGCADLTLSVNGDSMLIEIEEHSDASPDGELSLISPLLARLPDTDDIIVLCDAIARSLKAMTGFDRVMVYRFAKDGSGEVISEVCAAGMDPHLGLRFPHSYVPSQARALMLRNTVRLIADVKDDGIPVIGQGDLDLSLSEIRAVSPVHLQYLRDIGVDCTMIVSLIVENKLWGLVSCHHRSPLPLPMALRAACSLFGTTVAQRISLLLANRSAALVERGNEMSEAVLAADSADPNAQLDAVWAHAVPMIPADAAALFWDGQLFLRGTADDSKPLRDLLIRLHEVADGSIWHSDHLRGVLPEHDATGFAGALVIPMAERQTLVLLRQAVPRTVRWAGMPRKPEGPGADQSSEDGAAIWVEEVEDCSDPWKGSELKLSEQLRTAMLELCLKGRNKTSASLRRANDGQEIVISELNHRMRNLFELIRVLILRSRDADPRTALDTVLERIEALENAHEQLTLRERMPLTQLLTAEARAFVEDDAQNRLQLDGPDHWIRDSAAPTVALVLHELVTNAVKHGALGSQGGQVHLRSICLPNGALRLEWRESGGPPVRPPSRKGFGRTIIEGTIPYELGGMAKTDYAETGFRATFEIPADSLDGPVVEEDAHEPAADPGTSALSRVAALLLVEDNMLIAMDTAERLRSLGAKEVMIARSVAEGIELARSMPPDLAILDISLGSESSLALAQYLSDQKCPLILATGHDPSVVQENGFPQAPVLRKPYDVRAISVLAKALMGSDQRS